MNVLPRTSAETGVEVFGRKRKAVADPKQPVLDWHSEHTQARFVRVELKRGRAQSVIELTCGDTQASFAADEVVRLLAKELLVIESMSEEPLTYLCWPESAEHRSAAAESVSGVAVDSLVFLEESNRVAPVATFSAVEVESLRKWLSAALKW